MGTSSSQGMSSVSSSPGLTNSLLTVECPLRGGRFTERSRVSSGAMPSRVSSGASSGGSSHARRGIVPRCPAPAVVRSAWPGPCVCVCGHTYPRCKYLDRDLQKATTTLLSCPSAHRCGHALAFCAVWTLESPGEHKDEGLPYVRERTSRTNHMRAGSPTGEEAGAAIVCSMASTVLPYCPSSLLPHPTLLNRGIGRAGKKLHWKLSPT